MQTHTDDANLTTKSGKKGSGRKGADGIEGTPDYRSVKEKARDCLKLYRKKANADLEYRESVKGLAQSTSTNAGSINKLVKASFKGKFADAQRMIDQQSEMFEEVGEVSDAGA